jgi:hypothetical protein
MGFVYLLKEMDIFTYEIISGEYALTGGIVTRAHPQRT